MEKVPERQHHLSQRVFWALFLASSLGLRVWLGRRFYGFLTGDDVEILQEGLRGVLHLSYVPWEIRNTLVSSLLVAPVAMVAALFGAKAPLLLTWLATFPFALLSVANILLTARLAKSLGLSETACMFAGLLQGLHWLAIGFGSTVYPRGAACTCILGACLLAVDAGHRQWKFWVAGALVALAFAFRYSEIIFVVPVAYFVLRGTHPEKRYRAFISLAGGVCLGTILFVGVPDLLEWGAPFASLRAFFEYTLVERKASSLVASQPFYWYLTRAHRWLPPALYLLLSRSARATLPAKFLPVVLVPVLCLSAIHHKDVRYLQGVVPFLSLLGGLSLAAFWSQRRKAVVLLVFVVTLAWSFANLSFLSKKSMAAVDLATYLATLKPKVGVIAAQQPWALGGQLILGPELSAREVPVAIDARTLERLVVGADAVAVYSDSLTGENLAVLKDSQLCITREFRNGRSRPMTLFVSCGILDSKTRGTEPAPQERS